MLRQHKFIIYVQHDLINFQNFENIQNLLLSNEMKNLHWTLFGCKIRGGNRGGDIHLPTEVGELSYELMNNGDPNLWVPNLSQFTTRTYELHYHDQQYLIKILHLHILDLDFENFTSMQLKKSPQNPARCHHLPMLGHYLDC